VGGEKRKKLKPWNVLPEAQKTLPKKKLWEGGEKKFSLRTYSRGQGGKKKSTDVEKRGRST